MPRRWAAGWHTTQRITGAHRRQHGVSVREVVHRRSRGHGVKADGAVVVEASGSCRCGRHGGACAAVLVGVVLDRRVWRSDERCLLLSGVLCFSLDSRNDLVILQVSQAFFSGLHGLVGDEGHVRTSGIVALQRA